MVPCAPQGGCLLKHGIEIERRVGNQMRLDYYNVASSRKLDHQKRDYVVTKKNAGLLPFPVDIQFTIRFNDLEKLLLFIKRQRPHPRRKRLYVRVHHPYGTPFEKVLPRIGPIAHAIEDAVMSVQQRLEGIFILSIEEDNRSELLSLADFVAQLEARSKAEPKAAPVTPIPPQLLEPHPEKTPYQCEIVGKIDLPPGSVFKNSKKIDGTIEQLVADGFLIRSSNGTLYWAAYDAFVARHRDVGSRLQRIFAAGNGTRLHRKTKKVLFEPTEEWHSSNGEHVKIATKVVRIRKE